MISGLSEVLSLEGGCDSLYKPDLMLEMDSSTDNSDKDDWVVPLKLLQLLEKEMCKWQC